MIPKHLLAQPRRIYIPEGRSMLPKSQVFLRSSKFNKDVLLERIAWGDKRCSTLHSEFLADQKCIELCLSARRKPRSLKERNTIPPNISTNPTTLFVRWYKRKNQRGRKNLLFIFCMIGTKGIFNLYVSQLDTTLARRIHSISNRKDRESTQYAQQ
jgi:hypothetical protein